MAKLTLADLTSTYDAVTAINANNTLIETALENTLSRDGTTPNSMSASLDMNSNRILNLPTASAQNDPVTLQQLQDAANATISTAAASIVTITDSGGYFDATHVEGALQEIEAEMASVATGEGASKVGIEDAGAFYTGTDVEAALAELRATPNATSSTAIELATQAEVDAGTDTVRAVTPATLTNFSGLDGVTTGSFTGTLTGCTTSPTATFNYEKVGNIVHLWIDAATTLQATSNSATMVITGLPAAVTPTNDKYTNASCVDNGGAEFARILVNNINQLGFQFGSPISSSPFTTSGTKGIEAGWSITYALD